MPTDIQHLAELDYGALFSSVVIFMAGWIALKTLLTKFGEATGIEMPWVKRAREHAEQVSAIQSKVDTMDTKIASIANSVNQMRDTVDALTTVVNNLNERQDANEAAQLKDRISQAYRYYHEKKQWNMMEKEAFEDLIEAYTRYSDNSFVHTICEPESLTWRIVDKD